MLDAKTDPVALLDQILADPDAFPDDFVVVPRDARILPRLFGRACIRILDELESGPAAGVGELAQRIGRDRTALSKDVHFLADWGLVRLVPRGRHVAVEATARRVLVT